MTPSVTAVVLTYDAPAAAAACVEAIRAQNAPVTTILVIDNASNPRVDAATLGNNAIVVRNDENLGPAGGYAVGLTRFLEVGDDFAWVMDDDCRPETDALALALAAGADGRTVVMSTMVDRDTGALSNTHGWCGVLIPRVVVADVGVPDGSLFWWTEDTEYVQWRIPRAGWTLVRSDARVDVGRTRESSAKPAWKYYYETRNQVHYRLHTQHVADRPLPRHLHFRVRAWRAARAFTKLGSRALLRERSGRFAKFAMVLRGGSDGLRGRLGRTVSPGDAHRPVHREAT
jgi:rhamnopyranosyl-N-acetylglucosaminyl-diphospho-decaprenol beta-1,3/1,4-galactofuranosyltransferase